MTHSTNRIAIVGAGGLGHASLWGLLTGWRARGELQVVIVDEDTVERSNLNRQVFFSEADLGKKKAEALCDNVSQLFSAMVEDTIRFLPIVRRLERDSLDEIIGSANFVIDGTD